MMLSMPSTPCFLSMSDSSVVLAINILFFFSSSRMVASCSLTIVRNVCCCASNSSIRRFSSSISIFNARISFLRASESSPPDEVPTAALASFNSSNARCSLSFNCRIVSSASRLSRSAASFSIFKDEKSALLMPLSATGAFPSFPAACRSAICLRSAATSAWCLLSASRNRSRASSRSACSLLNAASLDLFPPVNAFNSPSNLAIFASASRRAAVNSASILSASSACCFFPSAFTVCLRNISSFLFRSSLSAVSVASCSSSSAMRCFSWAIIPS
mmetsp:Transcript_87635/g.200223  ORF Transcript_87635/g.200223 Transcript_87635/m.200223 type:complete len:274 (-) Transcript_87635:582-1403(-)